MPPTVRQEQGAKIWSVEAIGEMDHSDWYDESTDLWMAVDLMKRCLALDCTKRVTAAEGLKHPFFAVSSSSRVLRLLLIQYRSRQGFESSA